MELTLKVEHTNESNHSISGCFNVGRSLATNSIEGAYIENGFVPDE